MTDSQYFQPAPGRYWVDYDNDYSPADGHLVEWWTVIDEQTGDTLCKCDKREDADRIAAMLNGAETPAPEGEPSDAAVELAAKAVYRLFIGADDHPWVEGGNSLKQCDARRYARAALAAPAPQAPVALTDIDLCRLISAHEVYQHHPGALHEFADAVIAEFCRVNGIPAPKEPTNDR